MLWTEHPALGATLAIIIAIAVMYLVRDRAHKAIAQLGHAGQRQLRLFARACATLGDALRVRNREVMLALQTEITRRQLEWDFQRVAAAVEQDMTKFQHLERAINEHITLLGEDFERSTQVPPAAPGWIGAVDAIAKLQLDTHPEPVGRILQDIHNSVQDQQREVMREYRWAVNARHKILADMRPLWRRLSRQVTAVGKDSRDLLARIHRVDTQMAAFRELCANRADVRVESFLARWLVALVLASSAAVVAVLNTHLLQQPLTVLFAQSSGTLPMLTAAVFTLAMMAMSLLVSECAHITRLLPLLDGLPRRNRILFSTVATLVMLALIGGESALLASSHGDVAPGWVQPMAVWGLASAGVVVPLVLALLSPAIESLLATSRPVLMSFAIALLSLTTIALRLTGRLWRELARLAHHVYDLLLFLPLSVEAAIAKRRDSSLEVAAAVSAAPNVLAVDFDKNRAAPKTAAHTDTVSDGPH
jgi:hypothetical protein